METIINDEELNNYLENRVLNPFFNHPEVGVYISSINGKFLKVNKKFCEILGYKEEEFVHMNVEGICLPESVDKVSQSGGGLFVNGKDHYCFEKKALRKDGSIIWLSFTISSIYNTTDKFYGYIGIVHDISNLKEKEEGFYNTNNVLESIFDTTSAMIAYLDADFRFIRVNKPYADAGGHPAEFYIGKNHFDLYPYGENEIIFRQAVETGRRISFYAKPFEYKEYPELGITYWDWDLIPVKNSYGRITGLIFSLVDVTKRKQAEDKLRKTNDFLEKRVRDRTIDLEKEVEERKRIEKALRQSEQRYREVFENTSDGMYLIDVVSEDCFKFIAFNPSMEKILGLKEADVCSKTMKEAFTEECTSYLSNNYKKCIELEGVLSYEEHLNVSRDTIYIYTTLIPIKDDEGKIYRILGVCRDITEYKKMSEGLVRAKEEAEYANNAKSEYIANMSHELRTPLNVILSAIQLFDLYLQHNPSAESDKPFRHLKSMKQNCLRLLRLVNNLIDTTRIDASFYEVNLGNFDIVNILEVITLSVTDYVKNRGIELSYTSNVNKKIIACDIDIIERIMLNLLSNAIKFTDSNGSIQVSLVDRGESIVISIKDNGIGIPEDKQKTIFERYKQVDHLLTRKQEGSGIGLSLVKSFVEMLEGKIAVRSKCGHGSEFIVELPCKTIPFNDDKEDIQYNLNDYAIVQKITVELSDIYSLKEISM